MDVIDPETGKSYREAKLELLRLVEAGVIKRHKEHDREVAAVKTQIEGCKQELSNLKKEHEKFGLESIEKIVQCELRVSEMKVILPVNSEKQCLDEVMQKQIDRVSKELVEENNEMESYFLRLAVLNKSILTKVANLKKAAELYEADKAKQSSYQKSLGAKLLNLKTTKLKAIAIKETRENNKLASYEKLLRTSQLQLQDIKLLVKRCQQDNHLVEKGSLAYNAALHEASELQLKSLERQKETISAKILSDVASERSRRAEFAPYKEKVRAMFDDEIKIFEAAHQRVIEDGKKIDAKIERNEKAILEQSEFDITKTLLWSQRKEMAAKIESNKKKLKILEDEFKMFKDVLNSIREVRKEIKELEKVEELRKKEWQETYDLKEKCVEKEVKSLEAILREATVNFLYQENDKAHQDDLSFKELRASYQEISDQIAEKEKIRMEAILLQSSLDDDDSELISIPDASFEDGEVVEVIYMGKKD